LGTPDRINKLVPGEVLVRADAKNKTPVSLEIGVTFKYKRMRANSTWPGNWFLPARIVGLFWPESAVLCETVRAKFWFTLLNYRNVFAAC